MQMLRSKSTAVAALCVAAVSAVAAVGAGARESSAPPASAAAAKGDLVIYGNSPAAQFKPVLDAFAQANRGVKVKYTEQESNVSFSKYRAENAQHARTADVIIASSPMNWANNRQIALPFTPTGTNAYPRWLTQYPGVFVLSPDPAVSVYNKQRLPANRVPHSFAELESGLKKYPSLFKNKLTTFEVQHQFGYSAFWGFVKRHGWFGLDLLGPASKPQADGTSIVRQVVTGASNYAYFESGIVRSALTGNLAKVAGWTYMKDFTPLVPRGIAITRGAGNRAAAKTLLNWLYSVPGQQALCAHGYTAFRNGVSCANALATVERAVGKEHVYLVPFHSTIAKDYKGFVARWRRAFR
jgi:iron(III) transport system substrate-binding protein